MPSPDELHDLPLALRYVRSLLERHGLPRYRQSAWLAKAVGLSYSQAHRRLNGASPWSLEDLAQLANLFGETLADLITLPEGRPPVDGMLRIGKEAIGCRLWLGAAVAKGAPTSVVAVKSRSGWLVASVDDGIDGDAYEIERLEARPVATKRRAIAVLDDDVDVTDSIASSFELLGYRAHPFYKANDLLAEVATTTFDGYVLDWVVSERTVIDLVRFIRTKSNVCPIIILTGQVSIGAIDEADIADAIADYGLLFCEKPARTSILAATLAQAFAAAQIT